MFLGIIAGSKTVLGGGADIPDMAFTSNVLGFSTSDLVLTYPPSISSGDLLLIGAATDSSSGVNQYSTPVGWVLEGSGGNGVSDNVVNIYSRIANGTETGTMALEASTGTSVNRAGFMIHLSHATISVVMGIMGVYEFVNGASDIVIPSITTVENDSLILAFVGFDGDDYAPFGYPAGYTKQSEIGIGGTVGIGLTFGTRPLETAAATGTATITQSVTDGQAGVLVSVNSAPVDIIQRVHIQSVYAVAGIAQKDNQAVREQSTYVITGFGVKDHQSAHEQTVYVITN